MPAPIRMNHDEKELRLYLKGIGALLAASPMSHSELEEAREAEERLITKLKDLHPEGGR